ncbi:MAG: FTR1 family iron permease [Gaiellales bacterium]
MTCPTTRTIQEQRRSRLRKAAVWIGALSLLSAIAYLMATAETGPVDPAVAARGTMSEGTVLFNSSMIVFREGLEAILILAAITASMLGANAAMRRPVFLGSLAALGATVLTWFAMGAVLDRFAGLGMRLEAITGFIAVAVLLVVMNWFMHNVYWTGWISQQNARKKELLTGAGSGVLVGMVLLGFTSVFREGFETVLFLQNLRLVTSPAIVLEGVAIGFGLTLAVGACLFVFQHRLPYKRMLVLTGILLGFVLVVMVGGTAATFQELGWLPVHPVLVEVIPAWMGSWFEVYPTVETLGAQALAAAFVIGSYYAAEYMKVRRPRRRGETPAQVATAPPAPRVVTGIASSGD